MRKARRFLEERSVPIVYDASSRRWRLADGSHEDPLLDPSPADLTLLVLGAALLDPFVDGETRGRVRAAVGAVGHELGLKSLGAPRPSAVRSSVTMRSTVDAAVLLKVLDHVQRGVLRIAYASPWTEHYVQHVIEPWGVQLVDGAMYLRAYSRKRSEARTFHLGFIGSCVVMPRVLPSQPVPPATELWGEPDTGFGVDEDSPDVATVRLRGPVARWLSKIEWHPLQQDRGPDRDGVLERSVPYRSRREFARRLLSYADAIVRIEPAALRDEVVRAVEKLRRTVGTPEIKDEQ